MRDPRAAAVRHGDITENTEMDDIESLVPQPGEAGFWYRSDLRDVGWRTRLPDAVLAELEDATVGGSAGLAATQALMEQVRDRLFRGHGVVAAGTLPVREWGEARARAAVALLARCLGEPVAQGLSGTTFYAVQDQGVSPAPGVRRSLTNVEQPFHSDGPWVCEPPWTVSMSIIRRAPRGGDSRCLSLKALFADLAAREPELFECLAWPLPWHRQGEHAAQEVPVSRHPMVWRDADDRWCARMYNDYVRTGYDCAGATADEAVSTALERLDELANEPHRRLEFTLADGELLWLNNRWCAHSRTAFETPSQGNRRRLLIRVWHRLPGEATSLDT